MKINRILLKPGIKACSKEIPDYQLAKIVSTLFENEIKTENSILYQVELIKSKNNCKTYKLSYGNNVYYLKKFFEQSLSKKILNIFRTTKAFRCYSISHKLDAANIPVAEPVMYLTCTKRFINRESIFVTKKVDGIPLREYLKQDISSDLKEKALKKYFFLLGHFYKNGFKHGDPGLYNFFIDVKDNNDYSFTFLDLDVIHKLPIIPVIVVLNGLAKLYSLSGSYFSDKLPIYIKVFLDACKKPINMDKAICYLVEKGEQRIIKFKNRKRPKGQWVN